MRQLRFDHRDEYVAFIRVLNSKTIRLIETKTGRRLKKLSNLRPFTRIISWGRDFTHMATYIQLNKFEAMGVDVWRRYKRKPISLRSMLRRSLECPSVAPMTLKITICGGFSRLLQ